MASGSAAFGPVQSRLSLYIIIVVLLALLFAVGAVAAYYVGKADANRSSRLETRDLTNTIAEPVNHTLTSAAKDNRENAAAIC